MVLTKQQKHKNSLIQKEQRQLLKIQKELDNIVLKVNEAINVLKVEELQLKSSAALFDGPSKKKAKLEKTQIQPELGDDLQPTVSQRLLNLQSSSLNLDVKSHIEVEEDDEDDI